MTACLCPSASHDSHTHNDCCLLLDSAAPATPFCSHCVNAPPLQQSLLLSTGEFVCGGKFAADTYRPCAGS